MDPGTGAGRNDPSSHFPTFPFSALPLNPASESVGTLSAPPPACQDGARSPNALMHFESHNRFCVVVTTSQTYAQTGLYPTPSGGGKLHPWENIPPLEFVWLSPPRRVDTNYCQVT